MSSLRQIDAPEYNRQRDDTARFVQELQSTAAFRDFDSQPSSKFTARDEDDDAEEYVDEYFADSSSSGLDAQTLIGLFFIAGSFGCALFVFSKSNNLPNLVAGSACSIAGIAFVAHLVHSSPPSSESRPDEASDEDEKGAKSGDGTEAPGMVNLQRTIAIVLIAISVACAVHAFRSTQAAAYMLDCDAPLSLLQPHHIPENTTFLIQCPRTCNRKRSQSAMVWGTGIYSDDSSVCKAARHSFGVKVAERETLLLTILGGQEVYCPSIGLDPSVTSGTYGKWHRSYVSTAAAKSE
jgi:hypothetical protein